MTPRHWIAVGALLAGLGVVWGAFGAHALHDRLASAGQLENWHTAVRYQVWHALALILVGILAGRHGRLAFPAWAFLLGSLCFSGSIYGLCFGATPKILGPITPLGGALLIAGWAGLAWRFLRTDDAG